MVVLPKRNGSKNNNDTIERKLKSSSLSSSSIEMLPTLFSSGITSAVILNNNDEGNLPNENPLSSSTVSSASSCSYCENMDKSPFSYGNNEEADRIKRRSTTSAASVASSSQLTISDIISMESPEEDVHFSSSYDDDEGDYDSDDNRGEVSYVDNNMMVLLEEGGLVRPIPSSSYSSFHARRRRRRMMRKGRAYGSSSSKHKIQDHNIKEQHKEFGKFLKKQNNHISSSEPQENEIEEPSHENKRVDRQPSAGIKDHDGIEEIMEDDDLSQTSWQTDPDVFEFSLEKEIYRFISTRSPTTVLGNSMDYGVGSGLGPDPGPGPGPGTSTGSYDDALQPKFQQRYDNRSGYTNFDTINKNSSNSSVCSMVKQSNKMITKDAHKNKESRDFTSTKLKIGTAIEGIIKKNLLADQQDESKRSNIEKSNKLYMAPITKNSNNSTNSSIRTVTVTDSRKGKGALGGERNKGLLNQGKVHTIGQKYDRKDSNDINQNYSDSDDDEDSIDITIFPTMNNKTNEKKTKTSQNDKEVNSDGDNTKIDIDDIEKGRIPEHMFTKIRWRCKEGAYDNSDDEQNEGSNSRLDLFDGSSRSRLSLLSKQNSMRHTSAIVDFYFCGNWHPHTNAAALAAAARERYVIWLEYLYYTILALIIQIVLGWGYAFPDGRPACIYDNSDGTSSTNSLICDLSRILENGQQQMRVLVAFILGGFITNVVYMWRLRRGNYSSLCGASRNLIIQIATLIPTSSASVTTYSKNNEEEVNSNLLTIRRKMTTWVTLGFELSILKAREKMETLEGKKYLMQLGLLDQDEWDSMVEGDRHTTVWFWLQQQAVNLCNDGIISELRLQTFCRAITTIRDQAGDLMSCTEKDQPIPYSFVVGLLVNLNLLLLSLSKGVQWAIWFYESEGTVWLTPKMYADVFVTLIYTSSFAMLYDISRVLYNPFGERSDIDIDHSSTGMVIRNFASRLGSGERCHPKRLNQKKSYKKY